MRVSQQLQCAPLQVIMVSYLNVTKAMNYYVARGGTAKFVVCDDGFQVGTGLGGLLLS